MRICAIAFLALTVSTVSNAAQDLSEAKAMFNGKDLTGWEIIGDGFWQVMKDGTLLGERRPSKDEPAKGKDGFTRSEYRAWRDNQSWLYTTRNDYADFDLHLEFWTRTMGNSGVSLRDH